jgi:hypothetical protein
MSTPEEKPARSWQEISKDVSHQTDPKKLAKLAEELARAIDESDVRLGELSKPAAKSERA